MGKLLNRKSIRFEEISEAVHVSCFLILGTMLSLADTDD